MKKLLLILSLFGIMFPAIGSNLNYQVYFPKKFSWGLYQYSGEYVPLSLSHYVSGGDIVVPEPVAGAEGAFKTIDASTPVCKANVSFKDIGIVNDELVLSGAKDHFQISPCGLDDGHGSLLGDSRGPYSSCGIFKGDKTLGWGKVTNHFTMKDGRTLYFSRFKFYPPNLLYAQSKPFVIMDAIKSVIGKWDTELSVSQYTNPNVQLSLNFQDVKLENF